MTVQTKNLQGAKENIKIYENIGLKSVFDYSTAKIN